MSQEILKSDAQMRATLGEPISLVVGVVLVLVTLLLWGWVAMLVSVVVFFVGSVWASAQLVKEPYAR